MLFLGRKLERATVSNPTFRQITFRGAGIGSARFAPDGQTIVFSTETEGRPPELLAMRLDSPEARPLGLPPAQILSITSAGQMALLLAPRSSLGPRAGHMANEQVIVRDTALLGGTLATAPLGGGAPRELLENVLFADWDSDGKELAAVHRTGNRNRLEFPLGTPVFDGEHVILNHVKMDRRSRLLAFKDWGDLYMKPQGGVAGPLPFAEPAVEIAWSSRTGEIWYTVGPGELDPGETAIHAISASGRRRLVAVLAGDYILYDISDDGRVLLGRVAESSEILGTFPVEPGERNLSYFDQSGIAGLSADGETLLIGGTFLPNGQSFIRKTDGSAPKSLNTECFAMSADAKIVLCPVPTDSPDYDDLSIVPTGPGPTRKIGHGPVVSNVVDPIRLSPDATRIIFSGFEPKRRRRVWVQDVTGKPRAITPEDVRRPVIVGDGSLVCAKANDDAWYLYDVDGKAQPRRIVGIQLGEEPIQSSPEGLLYVRGADELRPGETLMTTRVFRVDPSTGRRELWKEIPPRDPRTGGLISTIFFSADGKTCVWTHIRYSTELVLADGLK
jgi:hypothetical protein